MYICIESFIILFAPFNCISLFGLPNQMLYYNHHIQCWDSEHMKWTFGLALSLLIIWMIILPLALFLKLYFNIKAMHNQDEEFKLIYGFMYEPYNESCWYWEFLIYSIKLYGALSFTFTARFTEGFNGLLILIGILGIYYKHKFEMPFKRNIRRILIYNIYFLFFR